MSSIDKTIGILKRALMESVYIGDATVNLFEQIIRRHTVTERLSAYGPPTLEEQLQSAKSLDLSAGKGVGVSRKLLEYQQSLVYILGNLSLHLGVFTIIQSQGDFHFPTLRAGL